MQGLPVVREEGGIARGYGHMAQCRLHFLDRQHFVAQLLQGTAYQQCLEGFLGDCALQRLDLNAGARARLFCGDGGQRQRRQQRQRDGNGKEFQLGISLAGP